jgi:hypothetical protein
MGGTACSRRLVADVGALIEIFGAVNKSAREKEGQTQRPLSRDGMQDPAGHDNRSRIIYESPTMQRAASQITLRT